MGLGAGELTGGDVARPRWFMRMSIETVDKLSRIRKSADVCRRVAIGEDARHRLILPGMPDDRERSRKNRRNLLHALFVRQAGFEMEQSGVDRAQVRIEASLV